MKKFIGLIVLAIMVVLPNHTKAAQYEFAISCPTKANGQLEVNWDETGLVGAVQCSLMLKMSSGTTLSEMKATFTPADPKIVSLHSVNGSGSWNATFNKNSAGTAYDIVLKSSTPVTGTGTEMELAKVIVDIKKARATDNCDFAVTPCIGSDCFPKIEIEEKNTCKIINGQYYGKNGTIVTEEQYTAECANNPQTGSFVPYMVIFAGIALTTVVYIVSRKNTKLYKI